MGDFAEKLAEELVVKDVFTLPVVGGVAESVVVTWIIMAVFIIASFLLTRNLKVENPSRGQLALEAAVTGLEGAVKGVMNGVGTEYVPYLTSILLFIGVSNLIGIFGFTPPTKDLNVTAALAIMSIILIEAAGIRKKGPKKWLKSFAEPVAIVAPINVLELFIRPLSLCMRLFGNVLGAFVVMKLIELVIPVGVPVVLSMYFDIFDGLIQAYVFVFLTGLFIQEAIE